MNVCYKCGSDKGLSVRSRKKRADGTYRTIIYMCKPCRRKMEATRKNNSRNPNSMKIYLSPEIERWAKVAKESRNRIARRFPSGLRQLN